MRSRLLLALTVVVMATGLAPLARAEESYSGRQNQLAVAIPRLEDSARIDGVLDDAAWKSAAVLTDFSQYAPVDGRPAENRTDVLIWYSPTAIFFGIRAHAQPGTLRATLANRDRISDDDHVQIYLSTFNDGRQALMFAVNALGAQADGTLVEGGTTSGHGTEAVTTGREATDLSADFVFESKGRLTDYGYEVEVRIPFKTLRYQSREPQDWGLHVVRSVKSTGHEDSWVPARRAASSFLAQAGALKGFTDLRRGLVLDLTPVVTAKADGAESRSGSWRYDMDSPEFGGNVRWGVTPNLTMNGTINPDFSQVESDAGQFVFDPRQALYFSEKRPFFLDGIEQFQTPNNLIYTRRIVSPVGAAKLTGKVSGTTLAYLFAVDDTFTSASREDYPVFNILRLQRDVGAESRAAFVYTDRIDGDNSNRVAAADARVTFRGIYSVQAQGAVSRTDRLGVTTTAPLWQASLSRNGRRYGLRAQIQGIDDDFRAEAGFISRAGIVTPRLTNQITLYGPKGSTLERWAGSVMMDGVWQYEDFVDGRSAQDRRLHLNSNFTLRGGWSLGQTVMIESFGFDEELYEDYALLDVAPDGTEMLRPFVGTPRLPNLDWQITLDTPRLKGFSGSVYWLWGRDENFYEWASANILFLNLEAQWRPTERLRVDGNWQIQSYERRTDGTMVGWRKLPRLKIEYQMTPAIFLRVVSQYDSQFQDDLRDDSRTNLPIVYVNDATGAYVRALGYQRSTLRTDFLFSYQPTPGTVVFAGYGSTLVDLDARDTISRHRTADGFFLKISYLFRMK
jgi:hypothetical protein